MADNKTIIWIVLLGLVVALALGGMLQKQYNLFSIAGNSMERSVPTSVQPSSTFQVIYSTTSTGKWGVSIIDEVSGGCTFPAGTTLKSVMLSDEGTIKTITVTAPSSGSCTFSGDYKFGSEGIKNFPDKTITILTGSNESACPAIVGYKIFGGECVYTTNGCEVVYTTSEQCESALSSANEVPGFDINMVLFKIGTFEVTLLMLIIVVVIFVLIMVIKK